MERPLLVFEVSAGHDGSPMVLAGLSGSCRVPAGSDRSLQVSSVISGFPQFIMGLNVSLQVSESISRIPLVLAGLVMTWWVLVYLLVDINLGSSGQVLTGLCGCLWIFAVLSGSQQVFGGIIRFQKVWWVSAVPAGPSRSWQV